MAKFEFVENQRGNKNLIFENYMYNIDRRCKNQWRCIDRKCYGKVILENNIASVIILHNHENHFAKITRLKTKINIKKSAKNSCASNLSIITEVTKKLTDEEIKFIPKIKYLNDECTRSKNKYTDITFDIPNFLKLDATGKKFLQFDSGYNEKNRIILFFSEHLRFYLKHASTILIDGTFWSVPREFYQLLTINCLLFGKFFPICFILITNKKEETYINAFNKLLEFEPCKFKNIIIDFELGLKNAVEKTFPLSSVFGCSFHFGQMCWRHIQKYSLTLHYINEPIIRTLLRNIINLIFVPIDDIEEIFGKLQEEAFLLQNDNLNLFIDYFKKNFIGTCEKKAIYEKNFWCCFTRILNDTPRTINSLEAWHRCLNFRCNIPHLNLGKFIEILIQETERIRVEIAHAKLDIPKNKESILKEYVLKKLCVNYNFYTYKEFLDKIERNIKWKFYNN